MTDVACFMVTRTDEARRVLRRYRGSEQGACAGAGSWGYHDASVAIGDVAWEHGDYNGSDLDRGAIAHDDPRWPTACKWCGTPFAEDDRWQAHDHRYFRADDGRRWPVSELPPGAMLWGDWSFSANRPPPFLYVALPPSGGNNLWCVDGPATSGGYWTREGDPPNVTVRPSILTSDYHGFLTAGVLRAC